jgi:GPH family glycoside/pentoside/hexuronide:cation symporter
MTTEPIQALRLGAFASPAFTIAALGLPIAIFLPPLYAELGISLTVIGTVFMLTRFFDVITDPLFGWLGDKLETRWGRRRPAIIAAVPFLGAGVYFAFFPGESASPVTLFLSMLLLYAGWTAFTISHTAWASELSENYDERSRIMGMLQIFGLLGTIAVAIFPTILDLTTENPTMRQRTELTGALVLFTLPLFAMLAVSSTGERKRVQQNTPIAWRQALSSIVKNRTLRRLLFADLLMGFQGGINGTVHFFFIVTVLQMPEYASFYLVALFATGLLSAPVFVKLSYRLGKHRTLCIGTLISSIGTCALFFLPAGGFWLTLGAYLFIGLNFGARDLLMRSIMSDVVDEDTVHTGRERSALYFSMLTLTAKMGAALAIGTILPVLDWVGFDPAGENTQATLDGVRFVVAATPTLVLFAVVAIMWNFPLDRDRQSLYRTELDSRKET